MTEIRYFELTAALRSLAPSSPQPPGLVAAVRRRAHRRRQVRLTGVAAGAAAALVLAVSVVGGAGRGPAGDVLSDSVLARYGAASAPAQPYRGTGLPSGVSGPVWVVGHLSQAGFDVTVVSYRDHGRACLGDVVVPPRRSGVPPGGGSETSCADGDTVANRWRYLPLSAASSPGADAVLYGAVPATVRIVRAVVIDGHLAKPYVATVASPGDAKDRFFLFEAPHGAGRALTVTLDYFDAKGQQVGRLALHAGTATSGFPMPCVQAATPAVDAAPAACSPLPLR